MLHAFDSRYRLREHRRSPWITVYQLGAGGKTRAHPVKGYAAADPEAIESLQDLLVEATRRGQPAVFPDHQARWSPLEGAPLAGQRSVRPWWRFSEPRGST